MNSRSRKQSVFLLVSLVLLGALAGAHGAERLTRVESAYPFPSPGGERLVFQSNRLGPATDIFRMDADGAIVFTGHTDGVGDLYSTEVARPSRADSPE